MVNIKRKIKEYSNSQNIDFSKLSFKNKQDNKEKKVIQIQYNDDKIVAIPNNICIIESFKKYEHIYKMNVLIENDEVFIKLLEDIYENYKSYIKDNLKNYDENKLQNPIYKLDNKSKLEVNIKKFINGDKDKEKYLCNKINSKIVPYLYTELCITDESIYIDFILREIIVMEF